MLLFISLLLTFLGLAWFLIRGGSPGDLASALVSELLTTLVSTFAPLLPLVIIVGAVGLMMRGGRKTK